MEVEEEDVGRVNWSVKEWSVVGKDIWVKQPSVYIPKYLSLSQRTKHVLHLNPKATARYLRYTVLLGTWYYTVHGTTRYTYNSSNTSYPS